MLLNILAVLVGLMLLAWAADRFVEGAACLARNLGVSPMLIGLTVVGFGTSAPEILVSGTAAVQGTPGLAIGNALGSNIANIGFILGITALVRPLTVESITLKREFPVLFAVSLLTLILIGDGSLDRGDGLILLGALALVLVWMVQIGRSALQGDPMASEFEEEMPPRMSSLKSTAWLALGLTLLLVSSRMLVWGAVEIATALGVSDLIIGLTLVAFGTSLPELAASITAVLKGKHGIAVGNVLGSNLYNLLAVLSLPGIFSPGSFAPEILHRDFLVMMGLTIAMFLISYGFGKPGRVNRWEGLLLLSVYFTYQGLLVHQASSASLG